MLHMLIKTIKKKEKIKLKKYDNYLVPAEEWHQISNPFKNQSI